MSDLFGVSTADNRAGRPLADRLRPASLSEVVGQDHLVGASGTITRMLASGSLGSLILWGPPGSGKTTVARLLAHETNLAFEQASAIFTGVADLKKLFEAARQRRALGRGTLLFIDEIHRFNKGQQDAFLPYVEDGTVTLIGATTENPSFSVNAALLSRCKVFRLQSLGVEAVEQMLERALGDEERGLGKLGLTAEPGALKAVAELSDGDARRALNSLELVAEYVRSQRSEVISTEAVAQTHEHRPLLYDKSGEEHYNVVSAFIKSMRGSDPDAAI